MGNGRRASCQPPLKQSGLAIAQHAGVSSITVRSPLDRLASLAMLEIQSVSKSFSGVRVLKDVSFMISQGEVYALRLPKYRGKS